METQRSCEVYDPETNCWTPCASLQVPRSGSRVVSLGSHAIAAVGGCDDVFGRAETQATIEIFSLETNSWSMLDTKLAIPRTSAAVATIDDGGAFFVAGGAPSQASVEVFNLAALPDRARAPCPSSSSSSRGGSDDESSQSMSDVEGVASSQSAGKANQDVADMPEGRMGCQAAVVKLPQWKSGGSDFAGHRNCVLVVGGELCEESSQRRSSVPRVRQLSSVAAYDLDAGKWCEADTIPAMTMARTTMALCLGVGRVASARLRQ